VSLAIRFLWFRVTEWPSENASIRPSVDKKN
jgi:hypothetical protein